MKKHKDKKEDKEKEEEKSDEKKRRKRRRQANEVILQDEKEEVDEHMDALVNGQDDLSEEFKTKAATIFETTVNSKVKEIAESMEADIQTNYEQDVAKLKRRVN